MSTYLDQYRIEGTVNLDRHPCLSDPETCPGFQAGFEDFKRFLIDAVEGKKATTIYKFGYGDYLFLTRRSEGSATVGFRALSKPYDQIGHEQFVAGALQCDAYVCEIYPDHVACFKELINRQIDFPAEYAYASVASRWIFRQFSGQVGVIGADKKVALIRRLMESKEYQKYLGIERFEDYIAIPQSFACDDLAHTEQMVAEHLVNARSRLFLVGIGHVKSGLLHRLKQYRRAVFLDVGQGLDAIAGIIDTEKPFFGAWSNHRIGEPELYADIDYLSYLPYAFVKAL